MQKAESQTLRGQVLKDTDFEEFLNLKELRAWEAFKSVCSGFLGNTRVPDYQVLRKLSMNGDRSYTGAAGKISNQ